MFVCLFENLIYFLLQFMYGTNKSIATLNTSLKAIINLKQVYLKHWVFDQNMKKYNLKN